MATIEKQFRVNYRSSGGTGSKMIKVTIDKNEFEKCHGNVSNMEKLVIPIIQSQFTKEFKGLEITGLALG